MWSNLRNQPTFLRHVVNFIQPKRTTFILKRKNPIRLDPMGGECPKKIKRRGYYYELIENTNSKKGPLVEVVLTTDVAGIGMRGEKIQADMIPAYRDLLLPKLAVYANSPEAQNKMKAGTEKQYSSKYSKIVETYLLTQPVQIVLTNDRKWTLKPWHVKLALRKNRILTNEDCIRIPKEISGPGPKIENKDFVVYLTMNKTEVFPLRCRIHLWSSLEPLLNQRSFDMNSPSEILFPDEQEIIDKILKTEQDIRRMKMIKGEL